MQQSLISNTLFLSMFLNFYLLAPRIAFAVEGPNREVRTVAKKKQEPKVRIGLHLIPFKKMAIQNEKGQNKVKHIKKSPLKYTLRAKLNKTNHFFIGPYHILTKPQFWIKKAQRFGVKIAIRKKFGKLGQVEEEMGSVLLKGTLRGQAPIFVLHGTASKKFYDKFGHPQLFVQLGLSDSQVDTIARKNSEAQKGG